MRAMYNHAVKRVTEEPSLCEEAERSRKNKLETIFGNRKPEYVSYGSLPGAQLAVDDASGRVDVRVTSKAY